MILVDTMIWVDFLHRGDAIMGSFLSAARVLMHPHVLGELALGTLRNRAIVLARLVSMPTAIVASDEEVFALIERQGLAGSGVGYSDAHLLASARLMAGITLWTRDQRLAAAATRLGLSSTPIH